MKIFDIDLIVTNKKYMQKYRKLYPDSDDTFNPLIEVFFRIHMKKLNMRFEYEELLFESSNKIHF